MAVALTAGSRVSRRQLISSFSSDERAPLIENNENLITDVVSMDGILLNFMFFVTARVWNADQTPHWSQVQ
jgi:hypothetical protein